MPEDLNNHNRLVALSGSDFEIADGEPDIRDWEVKDLAGKKIGEVDDLLFSPETYNVRYLVVRYEDNDFDLDEDRLVLVPIGIAELHPNDDDVIIPAVNTTQLETLPDYEDGNLTIEEESAIRNIFENSGATTTYPKESFYNHEHFDEVRFYNPRKAVDDHAARLPVIVSTQTENNTATPIDTDVPVINPLDIKILDDRNTPASTLPDHDLRTVDNSELPGDSSDAFVIDDLIVIPDTDVAKKAADDEEDRSKL